MKTLKFLLRFSTICIVLLSNEGKGQSIYFNNLLNLGDNFGVGMSVLNRESGYIVAGVTEQTSKSIGVFLIDSLGNLTDIKIYGEPNVSTYAGRYGSLKESNNCYILAGTKVSLDKDIGYFLKLNDLGDTIFTRTYENPLAHSMNFNSCNGTYDEGYIFTGSYYSQGDGVDVLLLKTDSLGNEEFRIHYGWSGYDYGTSVFQSPDSGYVVGGYSYIPGVDDSGEPLILKFDKNGNYQWYRKPGGWYDDYPAMVAKFNDSSFVALTMISDSASSPEGEYRTIRVMKYGYASAYVSDIIWDRTYGQSTYLNRIGNIKVTDTDEIICCGSCLDSTLIVSSGWIMKLEGDGDSLWYRNHFYNGYETSRLYDIHPTSDNGFISCGKAYSDPPNSLQKVWIVKTDSLGCDTAGCDPTVGVIDQALPEWDHLTFFPNPSLKNAIVKATYADGVFYHQDDELVIFDVYGRKKDRVIMSQNHAILNLDNYSPGLHIGILHRKGKVIARGKFIVLP